jgi:hypothetical protein
MDIEAIVRQLADKQAIYEVVLRYCRGVDRVDMDMIRSAYHPDGIDNHTGFSGPLDAWIAFLEPALRRFDGTTHIVCNHLSEIAGDAAVAETYGTAVHWGQPHDEHRRNFTTGFRYIDHMVRRDGRWAIQERWAAREWTQSNVGRRLEKWGEGPVGTRDAEDPLAKLRKRLGFGAAIGEPVR